MPPLLLLCGMMCDRRLWQPQLEALSPLLEVRVGEPGPERSIAAMAQRLLEAAPPRFALAGLSMGGIVAFEIWRQAPQRVLRLALLDTNYREDPPERRAMRERQIADVERGRLREVLREELKPNYLASAHREDAGLLDRVLTMGMDLGPELFIAQSLALRDRADSSQTLASISCPTLVLCGDEDSLCPPALHRTMAERIPGAELQVLSQCGHLSTLEQPEAVNDAMRRWLAAA